MSRQLQNTILLDVIREDYRFDWKTLTSQLSFSSQKQSRTKRLDYCKNYTKLFFFPLTNDLLSFRVNCQPFACCTNIFS